MQIASLPPNENARLGALAALRLVAEPEERFDRVTRLAAEIFEVPMAFVSFIERDRQWFKSRVGLAVTETPRDLSFCAHAILGEEAMVVPDTREDARFADNPLVTGEPHLRFYMGQPLRAAGGEKIGTLCIADRAPRSISPGQVRVLERLGALVEREFQLGELIEAQEKLLETQRHLQAELAEAAAYIRSLIPPPCREPAAIDWRYLPSDDVGGDCLGYHRLSDTELSLYVLDICGHGIGPALLGAVLMDVLRSRSLAGVDFRDPAAVLAALNAEFPMTRHGRFFTIWYGVLESATGRLRFSSAGHPPALVVDRAGGLRPLATKGLAVGCVPGWEYENAEGRLEAGDALYLFSDGAFELRGVERVTLSLGEFGQILARSAVRPDALDAVLEELRRLNGFAHFADDVSLVEVRLPARAG